MIPDGRNLGQLGQVMSYEEILYWINEDKDTADFVVSVLNNILKLNKVFPRHFGYSTS